MEEVFRAECIFIPMEPFDRVGYSDGVVRFVAEDRVLINDYATVDAPHGDKLREVLDNIGLKVDTLPMFEENGTRRPNDLPSAVGSYDNYLRVGYVVVVPGYGRPEDDVA